MRNTPNERIQEHEIYREYQKKFKAKNEKEFFERVIKLEKDKLFYFVSAYPQKVVLVKSGEKDREKSFLGYEFSNRRGSEGIHSIRKGKSIDECTQMFDPEIFDNPEKASTYIYKAFTGDFSFPVHESISSYVSRVDLVDMMTWDRVEFEKTISTSVKKKIKIESKWDKISLWEIAEIINGFAFESAKYSEKGMRVIRITNVQKWIIVDNDPKFHPLEKWLERFEISEDDLLMSLTGNVGRVWLYPKELLPAYLNQRVAKLEPNSKALKKYLFSYLNTDICEQIIIDEAAGLAQKNLSTEWLKTMKIPLPPLDIQQKIVDEMEEVEKREDVDKHKLLILKRNITHIIPRVSSSDKKIDTLMNEGVIFQVQDGNHGEKHPKSSDYVSSWIPFIMASDLQDNNLNIINCKFVSQKLGDTLRIWFAKEWDILLTHKWSIWFCDIVSKLTTDYIMLTPQVTYYRINIDKILPKFLKYYFLSDEFQDELKNLAKEWQSTRDYIWITKQKQLKIPLPPLSEQHRIVTEIEKIETEIGALESELASIPVQKETILKKYL